MKRIVSIMFAFMITMFSYAGNHTVVVNPSSSNFGKGKMEVKVTSDGLNDTIKVIPNDQVDELIITIASQEGEMLNYVILPAVEGEVMTFHESNILNGYVIEIRDRRGVLYYSFEV